MSKAIVFFSDGMEECEALITVDLLRRSGIEVVTASIMGREHVLSSHKIEIKADALAESVDYSDAAIVILPGGVKGVENLKASKTVVSQVKAFAAEGKKIAAICAAPSIFAELGLLDGKTATVNPGFEAACPMAKLTHGKAAVDGNIITGQAVGGSFEFAREIIRALEGDEAAEATWKKACC